MQLLAPGEKLRPAQASQPSLPQEAGEKLCNGFLKLLRSNCYPPCGRLPHQVADTSSVWRWACSGRARSNCLSRCGDTLEAEAKVVGGGYVRKWREQHT
eukprot:scaffold12205_cov44-Phaeocystis_antarctica.AAC.1